MAKKKIKKAIRMDATNDGIADIPKKRGRKTKKNKKIIEKILELTKKGKTMEEVAEIVGVCTATIRLWKQYDFDFSASLKEMRQEADDMVEACLFKRATGYTKTYKTEKITKDGDVVEIEETIYVPAHPTAQIFWLKNRNQKEWRDKVDHGLEGKDGEPINIIIKDYTKKEEK